MSDFYNFSLVDTTDLKSVASEKGRAGSSPARGTNSFFRGFAPYPTWTLSTCPVSVANSADTPATIGLRPRTLSPWYLKPGNCRAHTGFLPHPLAAPLLTFVYE